MPGARYGSAGFAPRGPSSYAGNAMRPTGGPHMPATSTSGMHRAPYNPNGGNHYHDGNHNHYGNHTHVIVTTYWPWGFGYPYYGLGLGYGYPYWGWGYSNFLDDDYNSQPAANYAAPQQQYYYNDPNQQQQPPYQQQPDDQQEQPVPETYPQQYPQQPGAARAPSTPPASQALTVVFKDGRPPEQVYNYLLTANTLTVLDQYRHDIPVDQIDVEATASVNMQAGVPFSLPVRTP
jgi:hypothetical protein